MPRLLACHAHPDDETLATGALLATAVQAQWQVGVLTATRGERGEVIGEPAHLSGAALGEHRRGELAAALAALGVTWHRFLDDYAPEPITDSGMRWVRPGVAGPAAGAGAGALVNSAHAAAALAAALADFAPDLVVTYDPTGGYHHPDHVRVHELVTAADVAALLWAATPAAAVAAARAQLALLPLGEGTLPGAELPGFATAYPGERRRIAAAPVAEQLLAARLAHATQVQWVQPCASPHLVGRFALSDRVWQPIMDEGYVLASGSLPAACEEIWA